MIYYIYEVPTEKNGATKDWEERRAYNFEQYQIEPIIVETMEGPDTLEYWQVVGDREWQLADEYGYPKGPHYKDTAIKGSKGGSVSCYIVNRNKRTILWDHVLEIRSKYKPRVYTRKMLAVEYNTTDNVIKSIIERTSYKLP
mgnify:CR=1 FL=1